MRIIKMLAIMLIFASMFAFLQWDGALDHAQALSPSATTQNAILAAPADTLAPLVAELVHLTQSPLSINERFFFRSRSFSMGYVLILMIIAGILTLRLVISAAVNVDRRFRISILAYSLGGTSPPCSF
ncbi:hypothetical protein LJC42_07405 [Eubacteriales bacterium OttesenSCG-928-K08]|nr:hypothetical protein [Eubacteriales bacterium OttesenSCG-928-K08]